jgi:hypothetical protein
MDEKFVDFDTNGRKRPILAQTAALYDKQFIAK